MKKTFIDRHGSARYALRWMNLKTFLIFLCVVTGCNGYAPANLKKQDTEGRPTPPPAIEVNLNIEEEKMLTFINEYRVQNGASSLESSKILKQAALWHSQDMAAKDYFNHRDSLGRSLGERIAAFGFRGRYMGENIALAPDAPQAMHLWKKSPSHNANMLNSSYKFIGIGLVKTREGIIWTTNFGSE